MERRTLRFVFNDTCPYDWIIGASAVTTIRWRRAVPIIRSGNGLIRCRQSPCPVRVSIQQNIRYFASCFRTENVLRRYVSIALALPLAGMQARPHGTPSVPSRFAFGPPRALRQEPPPPDRHPGAGPRAAPARAGFALRAWAARSVLD